MLQYLHRASVNGKVSWEMENGEQVPNQIRLTAAKAAGLWVEAEVDSLGNYSVQLPAGTYQLSLPDGFIHGEKNIYRTAADKSIQVNIKAGEKAEAPAYVIPAKPEPDLLPEKGVLHAFNAQKAKEVDRFCRKK